MDRDEARRLLDGELARFDAMAHGELAERIGDADAWEVVGASGVAYQVEVDVRWDARPGGAIRVIASIDDGGLLTAFSPVTASILVDPDAGRSADP